MPVRTKHVVQYPTLFSRVALLLRSPLLPFHVVIPRRALVAPCLRDEDVCPQHFEAQNVREATSFLRGAPLLRHIFPPRRKAA